MIHHAWQIHTYIHLGCDEIINDPSFHREEGLGPYIELAQVSVPR